MLLTLLLIPITIGCRTVPKRELILPPKPQREIQSEIKTMEDVARLINYYEHLVEEWELWGDTVEKIIGECK